MDDSKTQKAFGRDPAAEHTANRGTTMKSAHITITLLLGVVLCGCASGMSGKLQDVWKTPLAEPKTIWDDLSKTRSDYYTRIDDGPVVRVRLQEIGEPSDRFYLLIHGVNTDHRTWQYLVGAMGANHNFILVDLPGCGESDWPNPKALGPRGYSPDALAEHVLQALDAHLARRDQMPQITLVGHSLGGTIAIRMMASPTLRARYDRLLRHVDRMVLLAPADVEIVNLSRELIRLAVASGLEFTLADLLGILSGEVEKATIRSVFNPDRALIEDHHRTYAILRHTRTRLALQAMLLQAVPRLPDGTLDWPTIDRLVAEYANVDVPCLIIWGAYDETLPKSMGYKLAHQIPTAELYVLDNCKHSTQLECPYRCADLILAFTASASNWRHDPSLEWLAASVADGQTAGLVGVASEG